MSYPAIPSAGAPPSDPFATSSPRANPAPAANGTTDGDMALEATVPMPVIQPSPIFPTGTGPLTPMRISPLDDDASGNAPPPSDAQPERVSEAQDVQEQALAEIPDEAVTGTTADQASPDRPLEAAQSETPEIPSVVRMDQVEQPAPESIDEAAPETTPLRVMETKPLPALESTGRAATNAMPGDMPDTTPDDMANDAPEPQSAPDSSSDDESVEEHDAPTEEQGDDPGQ